MYFYTFQFVFLSCVSQFLGAAPNGNLPFEVDVDSGNVGIDTGLGNTENGLTAQASKQGENFVESPKPADVTQGFSFDSKPESSSKTKNKPTKTTTQKPILTTESTPANLPTTTTGAKQKRKPISELSASPSLPTMNAAASMMNDPFFAYAMKEFMRQQQMLMSLLSSDFMGMGGPGSELGGMMNPMFPFGGSPFQMPSMADMQQSLDVSNMELIEDRVIDDDKGKGHLQTYKSKDGTAVIQTVTYSTLGDGSVIPATPAEQVAAAPTAKSTRPRLSRAASSARAHSPRRVRVH